MFNKLLLIAALLLSFNAYAEITEGEEARMKQQRWDDEFHRDTQRLYDKMETDKRMRELEYKMDCIAEGKKMIMTGFCL